MKTAFYITEPSEGLFNLRMTKDHTCLHSGRSLDKLLGQVSKYVRKYGDRKTLEKRMRKLNYNKGTMNISEEGKEALEKMQKDQGGRYKDLLDLTIETALIDNKNRPEKTPRPVKLKLGIRTPVQEKTPEISDMKQVKTSKVKIRKLSVTSV